MPQLLLRALFISTAAVVAIVAICGSSADASVGFTNCTHVFIDDHHVPYQPDDGVAICRDGVLAISYDPFMLNPAWSSYYITPADIEANIPGRDSFYADPDLRALGVRQASKDADIWSSTWNRGHLAPSRIMSFSEAAKKATYTCANIAPQYYKINQQSWQYLETDIFNWVGENSALHIITGVAYIDRKQARRDPESDIAYPDYYWTVICDTDARQSAGFVAHNVENGELRTFLKVQEVEDIYGGELFPDFACHTFEVDRSHWGWDSSRYSSPSQALRRSRRMLAKLRLAKLRRGSQHDDNSTTTHQRK